VNDFTEGFGAQWKALWSQKHEKSGQASFDSEIKCSKAVRYILEVMECVHDFIEGLGAGGKEVWSVKHRKCVLGQ
jgi:hypothetical protein